MSEKTEDPTDKKVRDSRKKGQVGQSQDITKLISCVAIFALLLANQDYLMASGKQAILLSIEKSNGDFVQAAVEVVTAVGGIAFSFCLTVVGVSFVTKFIGVWIQVGPLLATESLKIDFNKFNPVNQLKNIFSIKKFYELGNNLIKAAILFYIFYLLIKNTFPDLVLIPNSDLDMTWRAQVTVAKTGITLSLVVLLIMSVFDFFMQKHFNKKQLKMSKDDIKREFKDSEGDPHVKGQLNAMRNEVLNSEPENLERKVKGADAVVVNPTHYAVALHYEAGETPLPEILCKGFDDRAKTIIAYAEKNDIPVIRYVWLARTLYAQKGKYIPSDTLQAVAAIYQALGNNEDEEQ